ncbi:MAG: hypothetical protein KZQ77_09665, partial [Candidatus Thiodiazotropha sp. (ex Notomyrtea botanica)]|nr:hypothetical protein [Candidatus Thiodiazotropha sp. (ex Notomyrtea botanica)]
ATSPGDASKKTAEASTDRSSDVIVQAKFKKEESSEESSMSTGSKSSGGFWVKVIFWLLIVVLAFIYIRSLAKHPIGEETAATKEATHSMQSNVDSAAAVKTAVKGEAAPTSADHAESEKVASAAESASEEVAGDQPAASQASGTASATSEMAAVEPASSGSSNTSAPIASSAEVEVASAQAPEAASGTQADVATTTGAGASDPHAESVAKILKEFDELREAADAEMEAMRNLIQAERELRDAMMVPPPPPQSYPRTRVAPGYNPYRNAPQYSPYGRP